MALQMPRFIGALTCALAMLGTAAAAQSRPFAIEDYSKVVTPSDPQLSPDGSSIVVVVSRQDYVKSAALELGPYNITVNALIPGLIDTALTRHEERYAQVLQDAGRRPIGSSIDEEEARKILTTKTPLGVPWIEPGDVAPVVVFLASDAARMVSGATYDVTAGDSAHNTA
jgi:NAD(P)-dependent dehydrogenase (short-subunit alcohol dehydrogenase family)